jgi:hypothetical protein
MDTSLLDAKKTAETYFGEEMRIIPEKQNIFESYSVRPVKHIWLKEIWRYRIIHQNDTYYFGRV